MEQIDKGVLPPIPRRDYTVLDRLGVGDSVLLESATTNRISPVVAYREARDGKKFACRKEQGKVRVWRTG
jgi:hypothetical protein